MFQKLWNFNILYLILLFVCGIQTVAFFFVSDRSWFYVSLFLFVALLVLVLLRLVTVKQKLNHLINSMNDEQSNAISNALTTFTLPVLIVSGANEIVWYNQYFSETVSADSDLLIGKNIEDVLGASGLATLEKEDRATISYVNRIFDVYLSTHLWENDTKQKILFFVDVTDLRRLAKEYRLSRLLVAFIAVDNLDDLTRNMRESERSIVGSRIQNVLEDWFSTTNGFSRKISEDRYIYLFEERDLNTFKATKFDILSRVRELNFENLGRPSISIGVGYGANLRECEEQAAQALDMALGRGGDQVAIKNKDNSYQFFGGISGSNAKRSRVRTRIVASALLELIQNSERVVLMGHKFADLDCFGSAYALASAIRKHTDTPVIIAVDTKTALVSPLWNRIRELKSNLLIEEPKNIIERVNKQTLLIVLDTHRPSMVECPELLDLAGTVVVIDHHRKAVDYISDAVIFYHEPAASSTAEMVSELLQYISETSVGRAEAEAMLSGIMLDTRNYSVNTGVRTFEASAFLRRRGADPVAVKKFFADSMEHYKIKNTVIATAKQIGSYAIAVNSAELSAEKMKLISSEAADALMNIAGVKASFVITPFPTYINISARSFGEVNVQLIMEKLGGGGHHNMAACQLNDVSVKQAEERLLNAIQQEKKENE